MAQDRATSIWPVRLTASTALDVVYIEEIAGVNRIVDQIPASNRKYLELISGAWRIVDSQPASNEGELYRTGGVVRIREAT